MQRDEIRLGEVRRGKIKYGEVGRGTVRLLVFSAQSTTRYYIRAEYSEMRWGEVR